MIRSMTAFASCQAGNDDFSLSCDIRSINHRYLDITQRLPEELRELETSIREHCRQYLERGKVDIQLRYQPTSSDNTLKIDADKLNELAELTRQAGDTILHAGPVSLTDVLNFPGILTRDTPDLAPVKKQALQLLDEVLEQLVANREREGQELKKFLEYRLQQITEQIKQVRKILPGLVAARRDKIRGEAEALVETNPERLEQALVDLLQKLDVEEELSRLEAHVKEAHYQLDQPAAKDAMQKKSLGRRLDFLMQEFNREANTLASKSGAVETTQAAVELKVLIEQMREQIQNVE